jgi:hypothetical protein
MWEEQVAVQKAQTRECEWSCPTVSERTETNGLRRRENDQVQAATEQDKTSPQTGNGYEQRVRMPNNKYTPCCRWMKAEMACLKSRKGGLRLREGKRDGANAIAKLLQYVPR